MRHFISSIVLGYVIGCICYKSDPNLSEFILYKVIPLVISLENIYVNFQAYLALKSQQLSDAQTLTQLKTMYIELYA